MPVNHKPSTSKLAQLRSGVQKYIPKIEPPSNSAINIFVLLIVMLPIQLNAQKIPQGAWTKSDYDAMGNFYLTDSEKLVKWENGSNKLFEYKNSFYGEIFQIDCYRGLTTLVFHKETSIIVLLDNTLSPIGNAIQLNNAGLYQVGAACLSDNNQIWIANLQTAQLILIDRNMNTVSKGAVFGQYTSSSDITNMKFRNDKLVMYTANHEILTFDRFGTFSGRHSFHSLRAPLLRNNDSYFFEHLNLLKFNHITQQIDTIKTGTNEKDILLPIKNQLYLLNNNTLKPINQ